MPADTTDRTTRLRNSALGWMQGIGPLLVDLEGPTKSANAAAAAVMPVCRELVADGLCTEDRLSDSASVFTITQEGRAHAE